MFVSKLNCEFELPIPSEKFTEEEAKFFEGIDWDELDFHTSSFFDYEDEPNDVSAYSISEDGQFYKSKSKLEVTHNDEGEADLKEVDLGIERQDFTGEIYFGTEILDEEHDYIATFRALLYKGDVKELELDKWEKVSNEERKEAAKKFSKLLNEQVAKKNSLWHSITSPFKTVICFISYLIRWVLAKIFHALGSFERWISK
jgi:hypothetical protein